MNADLEKTGTHTGGCLCGAVRYEINDVLNGIVNCHCSKCRKFHGHYGAYTSIRFRSLILLKQKSLKWYKSITDETPNVYRGFCKECGSSLFWHPRDHDRVAVAVGSLDDPINLQTIGHIWISQIAEYYQINDDLPQYEERWE